MPAVDILGAQSFEELLEGVAESDLDEALRRDTLAVFGRLSPELLEAVHWVESRSGARHFLAFLQEAEACLADRRYAPARGELFAEAKMALARIFMERRRGSEFLKWCEEAGVTHLLKTTISDPRWRREHWAWLRATYPPETTLMALLSLHPQERRLKAAAPFLYADIESAVRRTVAEQQRIESEEQALLARPLPEEPALAHLASHLRKQRIALGRSSPTMPTQFVLRNLRVVDQRPLLARWEASGDGQDFEIEVPLESVSGSFSPARCSLDDEGCGHLLLALDEALELVYDEIRAPEVLQLVLRRWQQPVADRFFERLHGLGPQTEEADDGARLWWSIDPDEQTLTPFVQRRGKRSRMLKPRKVKLDQIPSAALQRDADADVLAFVQGHEFLTDKGPRARSVFVRALRRLVGHPRLVVAEQVEQPVSLLRARIKLVASAGESGFGFGVVVEDEHFAVRDFCQAFRSQQIAPEVALFAADGRSRLRLVECRDEAWRMLEIFGDLEPEFTLAERADFVRQLPLLSRHLPVEMAGVLEHDLEPALRQLVVVCEPRPADAGLDLHVRIRPIAGSLAFAPGEGPVEVYSTDPSGRVLGVHRDFAAELVDASSELEALGLSGDVDEPWSFRCEELESALELVERLRGRPHVETEWPRRAWKPPSKAGLDDLNLSITAAKDWFGLEGGIEIDGQKINVAILLDAARQRKRFVRLNDGAFAELAQSLRDRLEALEPMTFEHGKDVELSWAAASSIEAWSEDLSEFTAPAAWRDLTLRAKEAVHLQPSVPKEMQAELRPYQLEGYVWMTRLAAWGPGAVLADDMGLGKTVQALAVLLDRRHDAPQLVVAPTSVGFNWERETQRSAPDLRPILYVGADRLDMLQDLGPRDLLIASYGVIARDIDELAKIRFSTVVLDEAQAIKNPATQRSKAVRRLQRDWTVALTGTPMENHLGELAALLGVVTPGLLGSPKHFRQRFVLPVERGRDMSTREALARTIRPFVLRRTKAKVARELPARTEMMVDVVFSKAERTLYEQARTSAVAHLQGHRSDIPKEQFRFQVLAALTRLRQLACHPALYERSFVGRSAKLNRLIEVLKDVLAEGRRALIFSQFTSFLALVRTALEEEGMNYLYLDGGTPAMQRGKLVEGFQDGEAPLFLLSLKAGGTGLNLTAADTVIHLDPWWNPAVEDQATDRAHRIGQTQPVTVLRLIARDTVEEKIVALHADKRELVAGVLEGTHVAGALDGDALLALISDGASAATETPKPDNRPSPPPS